MYAQVCTRPDLAFTAGVLSRYQSVGTLGLGYPLLLCLGMGHVVILGYVQTTGPLWSGVLFSRQRFWT